RGEEPRLLSSGRVLPLVISRHWDEALRAREGIAKDRLGFDRLCSRVEGRYPADFLWTCTLVSTGEPCAMCAGALYWANIGRLVYGFEEAKLLAETGAHAENPTLSLAARTVLGSGQKPIEVVGPVSEIEDELLAPHRTFWRR